MTDLSALALSHLRLVAMALAAATVIALGLGVFALRRPRVERALLAVASLVQAIPAIALLAVMVPLLAAIARVTGAPVSGIGALPAFLALTLYALLPIVRGLLTGVRGIDRAVVQASHAVGMTDRERLRLVEMPLAASSVLGGLRTASVWTVGMATLGTPVGAASLGNLIFGGLQTRQYDQVAIGCAAAAVMALSLDAVLASAERRAIGRRGAETLAWSLALVATAGLASAAPAAFARDHVRPVRIGAKSFTEQLVLAELLRCAVGGDQPVDIRPSLGTTVAFDALAAGELDLYVEYTGTAWTTILARKEPAGDGSRDAMRAEVARELGARFGVRTVAALGFENAYALVVRASDAARSASDLGTASDRVVAGDYEFFERSEWSALKRAYGLAPRETRPMDPSLLLQALATGGVDLAVGYTTDGRIETMKLRALDEPKGAIPPYDAIVLASPGLASRQPALLARVARLAGTVDAETMRRWNAAVDSGASPREVVRAHPACR